MKKYFKSQFSFLWMYACSALLFISIGAARGETSANERQEKLLIEKGSQCLKERTPQCLLKIYLEERETSGKEIAKDDSLLSPTTKFGNAEIAQNILHSMYFGDAVRSLLQKPPSNPDGKLQLLFTAGEYEAAKTLMISLREQRLLGIDNGAIHALMRKGDMEEALKVAEQTIDWLKPLPPPPAPVQPPGAIRAVALEIDDDRPCWGSLGDYAQSVAELSEQFARRKEFENARKAIQLVRQVFLYRRSASNKDPCDRAGQRPYGNATLRLANALSKNGKKSAAKEVLENYFNAIKASGSSLQRGNPLDYATLASAYMKADAKGETLRLAKTAEGEVPLQNKGLSEKRSAYDYSAVILAEAGEYATAFERVSNLESYEAKMPWGALQINALDIKINSLLELARRATSHRRSEEASAALKQLEPLLGKRDDDESNISDYAAVSNIYLEMGQIADSKTALNTAAAFAPNGKIPDNYYDSSDYGRVNAEIIALYARHKDWGGLDKWASNGILYRGALSGLAKTEQWEGFDRAFLIYQDSKRPVETETRELLVTKKQYERYSKVIGIPSSDDLGLEIIAAAFAGDDVPEDILSKAWTEYIHHNYQLRKPPKDILRECFSPLFHKISYLQRRKFIEAE